MTTAQKVIKLGYDEDTRNLNFKVECENVEDFKKCVEIIKSYNEFDSVRINKAVDFFFNDENGYAKTTHFSIGREGSPVIYLGHFTGDNSAFFGKCSSFADEVGADEKTVENAFEYRIWFD